MNKNKKKFFLVTVLLIALFFLYAVNKAQAASGCCVKNTKAGNYGTSNCIKNVASAADCTKQWPGGTFVSGDSSCNGSGTSEFCTTVKCNGNNYAGTKTTNVLNCYKDCGETASCVASCDKCFGLSATTTKTGCCIKSNKKDNYGTSNCIKNVTSAIECTKQASGGIFESGEANCDGDGSKEFCTDASSSDSSDKSASSDTSSSDGVSFTNPLDFTTIEDLVTNVLSAVQKIVGVLALVMLVIGALMYILSAGEEAAVERGKKTITMAIIGLAIAIAAPSILLELSTILGWSSTDSTITDATSFSTIAVNVLNFLLGIAGVLSIIMTVIGGIMYLTSAGDEGRIEKGKDIFKFSVIGIIIVLASMVIVRQIASFFSA